MSDKVKENLKAAHKALGAAIENMDGDNNGGKKTPEEKAAWCKKNIDYAGLIREIEEARDNGYAVIQATVKPDSQMLGIQGVNAIDVAQHIENLLDNVPPARGILASKSLDKMLEHALKNGGEKGLFEKLFR